MTERDPGCPRCFIENKPCARHCDPAMCPDLAHGTAHGTDNWWCSICTAWHPKGMGSTATEAHAEWSRRVEESTGRRTVYADVRLTGSDVEPTGVVEVSIEALRALSAAAGWELVERPIPPGS